MTWVSFVRVRLAKCSVVYSQSTHSRFTQDAWTQQMHTFAQSTCGHYITRLWLSITANRLQISAQHIQASKYQQETQLYCIYWKSTVSWTQYNLAQYVIHHVSQSLQMTLRDGLHILWARIKEEDRSKNRYRFCLPSSTMTVGSVPAEVSAWSPWAASAPFWSPFNGFISIPTAHRQHIHSGW